MKPPAILPKRAKKRAGLVLGRGSEDGSAGFRPERPLPLHATILAERTGFYPFQRTSAAPSSSPNTTLRQHLVPTATQTACPYKGVTSGYWSVGTDDQVRDGHQDLAWAYDYPTRQLLPIAGLIAFYNEKIDIDVDGLRLPQARTHFFK